MRFTGEGFANKHLIRAQSIWATEESATRVLFAAGRMTELGWARDIFPAQRLDELRQVAEVDVTHATDEQTLKEKAKDADIIIGAATRVTADIIN
jgi:hypothetical protein